MRNPVPSGRFGGMNPARTTAEDYIQFLIASPAVVSATEAARVQPARPAAPAHDSFTASNPTPLPSGPRSGR